MVLSFEGKFVCVDTECQCTTYCSSHATLQASFRKVKKTYELVVRLFKKVCKHCQKKSEVHLNFDADDEIFERTVPYIALQICLLMKSDTSMKLRSKNYLSQELAMCEPIQEISEAMKYFHSQHYEECCACIHGQCVYMNN